MDIWPVVVRLGWFLAGLLAVLLVGRLLVQPAFGRLVRRRNANNPTLQDALLLYFRLAVLVLGTLVGVVVAGYGRLLGDSALLVSAIALAVGVAAQEVIGSIVSGVALVLDPEFNVGDHIEWANGQGVVQSIALRVTRVETADGELVTIPNTILTSGEITRPFGRGHYRIVQRFHLGHGVDLDAATAQLEAAAASIEGVLSEPPPTVFVEEVGAETIAVRVHYWIDDPTRRDVIAVRSRVARAATERFEAANVAYSPTAEHLLRGRLEIEDAR